MKLLNTLKYIAILTLGAVLMPALAMASGVPQFSLSGVQNIMRTSATVYVSYNGSNAGVDATHRPIVLVNYTNTATGVAAQSSYNLGSSGTQVYEFPLNDLTPGATYTYRAVVTYNGMNYATADQTFTTKNTNPSTSSGPSATNNSEEDAVWQKPSISWLTDLFRGAESVPSKVASKIATGGAIHKNNVGLSIANEQATVERMDSFTYTIKYENLNTVSLKNAKIVVALPEQYEFVKSSFDADYNREDNTVTFVIGRVASNTLESLSFKTRAIGEGNKQVETKVTLSYDGGTLTTVDRDSYDSGSKSVLGASVFGAGFFPQTLGGWMLIIVFILILVIIARRYMNAPAPKPEEKKAA
jgi:hypothetical protein